MRTYEAMILFDSSYAADFTRVEQEVGRLMERADAQILINKRWDERRLAYEIKGHKRGLYVLTYFKALPDKLVGIERDVTLSESILRIFITRADHMTPEDMETAYPTRPEAVAPAEENSDKPEQKAETSDKVDAPEKVEEAASSETPEVAEAAKTDEAQATEVSNVTAADTAAEETSAEPEL